VVTALGIKKEKKALGYATTSLSAGDLQDKANGDISRILMGKAAGVNVVSASGLSGSGTSIIIRGLSGLGDNQPLVVIDGVRFNSATTGSGFSSSSRFADLDPNNIESMNILKGLSASALYGTEGRNGVVVITTKSGSATGKAKKTEITINSNVVFNEIASLPKFTNQRGQGYYGAYFNYSGNWGATFGEWGTNNVDALGQIRHPYGANSTVFQNAFPDQVNARVDYKNYRSQENFFRQGVAFNNNISINGGGKDTAFNLYFGNLNDQGFMPGNTYRRYNVSIGGTANLTNKFTISGTVNYANIRAEYPFTNTIMGTLFNTPRSIDLAGWPSQHPTTGQEISFNGSSANPYWYLNNAGIGEVVNRIYGQLSATYKFNSNLNAVYRFGYDNSSTVGRDYLNRGHVATASTATGTLNSSTVVTDVFNHTLMLNYTKRFFKENIGVDGNVGIDVSQRKGSATVTESTNQTIFGKHEHNFFQNHSASSANYVINRPGYFAQLGLDYKNFLFLSGSVRKEWASNFGENNSVVYPGISSSLVVTDALKFLKNSKVLSFLKVRAGYGTNADFNTPGSTIFGGNFTPYPLSQVVGNNPQAFESPNAGLINTNVLSNTLANLALRPAQIIEKEIGVESKFLKNRISLDVSYFNRETKDLIFSRNLDPSTGYTSTLENASAFAIWGWEIETNFKIFDKEDFKWSLGGNFTKIGSKVTELKEDRFILADFGDNFGNYLVLGQPVGVIMGTSIQRDANGNLLVDSPGENYLPTSDVTIIGDPTPDFTLSGFTAIEYKNIRLTANIQYQHGGDVYLTPARNMLGRGLTTDTDGIQGAGFILPGVRPNGTVNDVVINTGDAYFNFYNLGPDIAGIFDASFIRLQEVALTYSIPEKMLKKTPFGNVTFGLVGENLYMKAINIPKGINADLNATAGGVNGNSSGIIFNNSPSARRFGFNIKLSF
jgi:TonB-linked SusC/RagA family outer membrane protein